MKGVLYLWLVCWAPCAGTRHFFLPWLLLVGPEENIFFLPVNYFNSFVPIAQQSGQAAELRRLSLSMCLWLHLFQI
jgi:hypothetical protein